MLKLQPEGASLLQTHTGAAKGTPEVIKLPAPSMSPGKSLVQALQDRQTSREFSRTPVPLHVISNLL